MKSLLLLMVMILSQVTFAESKHASCQMKSCPMKSGMGQTQPIDTVNVPSEAKKPGPKDKCPVCGMFVAKYPGFLAQVQFKDSTTVFFDGPKDLFKYYRSLDKYSPGNKVSDIKAVFVTNYYTQSPINALTALYIIGSDITGPMGKELVPFEKTGEAADFKKDHNGTAILLFNDVTPEIIGSLDK